MNDFQKDIIQYEDEIIGKEFEGKYGKYIVLGATNKKYPSNKSRLFICKFYNPEYYGLFSKASIKSGKIKNKYYPIINGVACIGEASKNHFLYSRWLNMIKRCYDENNKDYINYGAIGIKVCDEWKCFENYIEGVKKVEGYNEELIKKGILELDKDKKNGKIYHPEYCVWITKSENVYLDNIKQFSKLKIFEAKNLITNQIIHARGIKEFVKEHNLIYSCVVRCLNGERKQHKNWVFKYL